MVPKDLVGEIAAIEAELAELDRDIDLMKRRRDLLLNYVQGMRALHADLARDGHGAPLLLERPYLPPPEMRSSAPVDTVERTIHRSKKRAFVADIVREAIDILYSAPEGEPMSAGEIHGRLSRRDALTPKQLYVALYKRASRRKQLQMSKGMFWPLHAPPPSWWTGDPKGSSPGSD